MSIVSQSPAGPAVVRGGARRVVVVGAGMGGLAAAVDLASRGREVLVLERATAPGGKMREVAVAGRRIDGGPTVFTMRWVFDALFADAGARLADFVTLREVEVLARHAWSGGERLDLYANRARSADAIGYFAGAKAAAGYLAFCERARGIFETLDEAFIRDSRPSPVGLTRRVGIRGLGDLWRISPFTTLWTALGAYFPDQRLRQLFGRYATYCGSSPFHAPATLMLVAHVEQEGVCLVEGGMHRLARALEALAARKGAMVRYGAEVAQVLAAGGRVAGVRLASGEAIAADAVILNSDANALAAGLFGRLGHGVPATPPAERSLSAVTWTAVAEPRGVPLLRHTVFFSRDYPAEFADIFDRARLPAEPTVYVCAQDRDDTDGAAPEGPERLLLLVNAPAIGDRHGFPDGEIQSCRERALGVLERCGLTLREEASVATTPAGFERLFPATGGALYGRASHGWMASFRRPGAKTALPGLYLAGGSVHPGPGVPMAALSGRLAARTLMADYAST